MKKILFYLLCPLFLTFSARADQKITASVTITNATINGLTFTLNGSTRMFTNNVFNSATMVLTNSDVTGCGSKTNLLTQIYLTPFSQVRAVDTGSNSFNLVGNSGLPMALSVSGTYASISYSTQAVAVLVALMGPVSAMPVAEARTNIASDIVGAIGAPENTNSIPASSKAASELVGTNGIQTIPGKKTFNNTNNIFLGAFYGDGYFDGSNVVMLRRDESGSQTSIYDQHANVRVALSDESTSMIGTNGSGFYVTPLVVAMVDQQGVFRFYGDLTTTSISDSNNVIRFYADDKLTQLLDAAGNVRFESKTNATRIYDQTGVPQVVVDTNGVTVTNSIVIKTNATIGNNISIGGTATVTGNTTIGGAAAISGNTIVAGNFSALGVTTNATFTGTNNFLANSDIAFAQKSITTLAAGGNSALAIGTNVVILVSGPTGAFSINGIAGGRDGKIILIKNKTGQTMTLANQSGLDPVPANRIRTGSGADFLNSNNPGIVTLEYDGSDSRWDLVDANN